MADRSEFPKRVRVDAWLRSKQRCEKCSVKIIAGMGPHYDHILPDALGGANDLSNCQVLCKTCHGVKTTKRDVPMIAKSQRIYEKNAGIRTKSGRPIPGSKRSGLKKRMDGSVERRG
jgi:5-methylcytosine-specific restriction protein A